jgi:alanyl-tRNA synthetase
MNAQQIRRQYLEFFKARGHHLIKRAPLVPVDDPTTLFTGSGMQPLLPYLLGRDHPDGRRLVDSQPSIRAQDIDEVGDNRHTTFFEMLGNWSLGDYFKQQQIPWFFEFLTEVVGLDPTKLYVSCFIGSQKYQIPRDETTAEIWAAEFKKRGIDAAIVALGSAQQGDRVGMQGGRIFFYDDQENWWSRGGGLDKTPIGDPCGPDSEVFYDFGQQNHDETYGLPHPASDSGRFMEIGNQVFMQYRRTPDGFEPLAHKNVDFGGGLERIAAAALDSPDIFRVSLMAPIIERLASLSGKTYESNTAPMRVIADHLRAATFLAADGVSPSNKEQGYVLRRLVRRALRFAFELGIEQNFLTEIVPLIAELYEADYPEIAAARHNIISTLTKEEKAFRQTLKKGLKQFEKIISGGLDGQAIFGLYDTYGFPVELSVEEAFRRGISVPSDWRTQFDKQMAAQRQRSQTAAKGTFKGGLGGQTMEHKRYHTATHLLQAALRQVLGDDLRQHGSNITAERLRFDFNLDHKMTDDDKKAVEALVNDWIKADLPVKFTIYPTKQALRAGAIGPFGERYGDKVKVYQIGPDKNIVSLEICGGPHVNHTGQLATSDDNDQTKRKFVISKEESSSAGIRRIKAVLQ